MLPFKTTPETMVVHLMVTVVFCVNAFVWKKGVSQFLLPTAVVEGMALDYNLHFHVTHGECVHTCEDTSNDTKNRTVGAIAVGPSGNVQGGMRCHSLLSGKVLHRTLEDVTRLKMPQEATQRVKCRAKKQKATKRL